MLDKKSLRKFADPGLTIPPGHGLLCAQRVAYIVRTAVRIINHRRVLVLYVYDRVDAANGDFRPQYAIFQTADDFTTLERRRDGQTAWREASFDHLLGYRFMDRCAFYARQDGERVRRYFREREQGGFWALLQAQAAIQDARRRARRLMR